MIPRRALGRTGVDVTVLGLGGEGILRTYGEEDGAYRLINRALDLGINYCESARAYSGSESYYGLALRERRKDVFLTSKSHARTRQGALTHLHETLTAMKTDHLDLWQVHDVRTEGDVEEIFRGGGAIEAFREAKEKGLARFIGVTGHHDPAVLLRCMERFAFDTVLMPVNPAEQAQGGFIREVLPMARQKQMGIIGMKVYFRGLAERLPWYRSMEPLLRYALSQAITNIVIGCDDVGQLEKNAGYARSFHPMTGDETRALVGDIAPFAKQLMYYKP
jgi:aryl-alcohol dehydrogenase-like predicted oxidoreductase